MVGCMRVSDGKLFSIKELLMFNINIISVIYSAPQISPKDVAASP